MEQRATHARRPAFAKLAAEARDPVVLAELTRLAALYGSNAEIREIKVKPVVRVARAAGPNPAAWADIAAGCAACARTALPALSETLAMHIADLADTHKSATLPANRLPGPKPRSRCRGARGMEGHPPG
jgi:histone H3/H4